MKRLIDMENNEAIQKDEKIKILVPLTSYNLPTDDRLLIPYKYGGLIGFVNNKSEILIKPKYNSYFGECYSTNDYVVVNKLYSGSFSKEYPYVHFLWGVIDFKGKEVIPLKYKNISPSLDKRNIFTVRTFDDKYAVLSANGETIVPFGKYDEITGFSKGYARVKILKTKIGNPIFNNCYGIINEKGEEVELCIHKDIWNFYGKNWYSTKIEISEGVYKEFILQ